MIARKWMVTMGVAVAVLGTSAAFSPSEAQAGHRGGGFSFSFNYDRGCRPSYYRSSYRSYGWGGYRGGYSYHRSYYRPRYYAPRHYHGPRYYRHCGW